MTLSAGTRLGPYEIVAPLGAGGMGEVYRARDGRLGRDVAVKVLPQHLSAHPEVRARFEREARAISSLNHPHICTLHDVGRENETDFLVMELVEGETLADRLTKGPLPPEQVHRLGIEIADALDRAHRAGIVHRDLKPGNVMLTRSGSKLMDFGLARATGLAGPESGSGVTVAALSRSPTISQPLTAEGTIVGTFQYMAPEQLEGKDADARSDLWALGCVLYEMASGRRAFEGKSQATLIAAIIEREPPPLSEVAPTALPGLDWIIRRCLAKDPEERWQSARDVVHELRRGLEGGSSAGAAAVAGAGAGAPPAARGGAAGSARLAWGVALVAVAAAAALAIMRPGRAADPGALMRLSVTMPPGVEFSRQGGDMALSPDGRILAIVAEDSSGTEELWLRALDDLVPRRLEGTREAYMPFWSPDGRSIGFFTGSKLMKIAVAGGAPEVVCDAATGRGGTWGASNDILFAPGAEGPLYRVPAGGGAPVAVTTVDSAAGEIGHRLPDFLPDGKQFLYIATPAREGGYGIFLGSLDSKERKFLLLSESAPIYSPPGWILFGKNGLLFAQRFDARSGRLAGDAQPLGEAALGIGILGAAAATGSDNGVLACLPRMTNVSRLAWVDRSGREEPIPGLSAAAYYGIILSPDGTRAVTSLGDGNDRTGGVNLWMIDLARNMSTRFTFDAGVNHLPIWSPDGSRVLYSSNKGGAYALYTKPTAVAGEPEFLAKSTGLTMTADDWSPDGRFIIYEVDDAKTGTDLWLLPLEGDRIARPLLKTAFNEGAGTVSPDSRWFAYTSDETGRREVYVQSFPEPGSKYQVSSNGGAFPLWRRDGRELIFVASGRTMMGVAVETSPSFRVGESAALFTLPRDFTGITVAPDGDRFLISLAEDDEWGSGPFLIVNWTAALAGK